MACQFIKYKNRFTVLALGLLLLQACAPSRIVAPLPAGERQLSFHVGGPLFAYEGDTMPMPLSSITYSAGLDSNNSAAVALHTTAMVYGVLQLEGVWTHGLRRPDGNWPGLSVTPGAHAMYDRWQHQARFYPALDFNAYWHYRQQHGLFYAGFGQWYELQKRRAHNESQPRNWLPYWQLGTQYWFSQWGINLELKHLLPHVSNRNSVVEYRGGVSHGALGLYFSLNRRFEP